MHSCTQMCTWRSDAGEETHMCGVGGMCAERDLHGQGCVCDTAGTGQLAQQGMAAPVGGNQHTHLLVGTCAREARRAWPGSLCTVRLTREARRDILLRCLGNSGLSICSFCKNSGGRRMSMGRERRLLTSCREGQKSGW